MSMFSSAPFIIRFPPILLLLLDTLLHFFCLFFFVLINESAPFRFFFCFVRYFYYFLHRYYFYVYFTTCNIYHFTFIFSASFIFSIILFSLSLVYFLNSTIYVFSSTNIENHFPNTFNVTSVVPFVCHLLIVRKFYEVFPFLKLSVCSPRCLLNFCFLIINMDFSFCS